MLRVASVKMHRGQLIGLVGTGLLVGLAVACSINPQPLPPDQDVAGASAADASSAANPGAGDSTSSDGGALLGSGGEDAGENNTVTDDAGDGGDGGEADASDAGDAGSEGDAGDAESDAAPDAG